MKALSNKAQKAITEYGIEACIRDFKSNEFDGNGSAGIVGTGDVYEIRACNSRIDAGREVYGMFK